MLVAERLVGLPAASIAVAEQRSDRRADARLRTYRLAAEEVEEEGELDTRQQAEVVRRRMVAT